MLPTFHQSTLPQSQQLWAKLKSDLTKGFKIVQHTPHPHDIIRVYTKHPHIDWQFLLVATSNHTNPPVFALELHIYPPSQETYQLHLKHTPIPQPQWSHSWKTLINMFPQNNDPDSTQQSQIINTYLNSHYDLQSTEQAYNRNRSSQWITTNSTNI